VLESVGARLRELRKVRLHSSLASPPVIQYQDLLAFTELSVLDLVVYAIDRQHFGRPCLALQCLK
jgi:hypothetical protein